MTASVYHLFKDMYERRRGLREADFSLDKNHIWRDDIVASSGNKGGFPDVVLKTNREDNDFSGGEMIEIKESRSYSIPSFNSTLPSGSKPIAEVTAPGRKLYREIAQNDNADPYHLAERQVYYLLRGRRGNSAKICLAHGSFFATMPANDNIKQAVRKILDEALHDNAASRSASLNAAKEKLMTLEWKQSYFSKTRHIENASINIRMRVMAEVNEKANILSGEQYPDIADNTLNIILPLSGDSMQEEIHQETRRMKKAFAADPLPAALRSFTITHFLGRQFLVFQAPLN